MPNILKDFSKIKDPRDPTRITHEITVLMMHGLLMFIFRYASRREANENLSRPLFFETIRKIFPEFKTLPHADTVERLLERIDPGEIEKIHIAFIRKLIKNKKFRKLLIQGCYPISIDGTQKLVRDDWINEMCCERITRDGAGTKIQQYVYVLEANLTLPNGLTIPLLTEYLYYDADGFDSDKQDSELKAFKRLTERLKQHFPRLHILLCLDGLYPCHGVLQAINKYKWEYIIYLPTKCFKYIHEALNVDKVFYTSIANQPRFRGRYQSFYWINGINLGQSKTVLVNALSCYEEWDSVSEKTGEIIKSRVRHTWICSLKFIIFTCHELYNLGARKRSMIEDSNNTEKNRGYQYKHAFSYDWNAMQCYHRLMRLAHALNAICEFTKILRKHIRDKGIKVTLDLIKETLSNPWLDDQWFVNESKKAARILLE